MRPLELVVEGFRSYVGRTTFDWRGRKLVGVVGPIGSGKSSILDAIAFALYGKTPAFERGARALIHHGSDHARVELLFRVEDRQWRVVRVLRSKGSGQHALYRADGDALELVSEREREVSERIATLLRLDFAAFNRSVLLAQNRFARFLNAPPAERDKVLKGVFGLDRIDRMHAVARQRRSEAKLAVEALDDRLRDVERDRERLDDRRQRHDRSAARARQLESAAEPIRNAIATEQEAARERWEAQSTLAELDQLTIRLASTRDVEGRLSALEAATAEQQRIARRRLELDQALDDAESRWSRTVETHGAPADLAAAEAVLEQIDRLTAQAAARHDRQRNAQREAEARSAVSRASRDRADAAADALARSTARRDRAEEALQQTSRAMEALEGRVGDRRTLADARDALGRWQAARLRADEARARSTRDKQGMAESERAHEAARQALEDAEGNEHEATERLADAERAHHEASRALAHARDRALAGRLRSDLAPGDPCPVCDRPIDAAPLASSRATAAEEAENTMRRAVAQAADTLAAAQDARRETIRHQARTRQAADDARQRRDEARQRWQESRDAQRHAEGAVTEGLADLTDRLGLGDPEARLRAAEDDWAEAERTHRTRNDARREAGRARRQAESEHLTAKGRAEADATRAQAAVAAAEAAAEEHSTVEQEIATQQAALHERLGDGDPATTLEQARQALGEATTARDEARRARDAHGGRLDRARDAEDQARRAVQQLTGRLANLAGSLGGEPIEALDPRALHDAVVARRDQRLAAAESRRVAADQRAREAARVRREHASSVDLGDEDDIEAALREACTERDRDAAMIDELTARVARADALVNQRDDAEARHDRYRQLAEELTAPRFLRYLLDEERVSLAHLGSERFEMLTGGRYRFTDDGTFAVVDLANAEAERAAETLSGGELFLASLALALALAEKVTRTGGRLDAFMLDEGFGALDPEHLDLAMAGIERLADAAPDRLVVVVSHVPALDERLDDLIELDKDPLTGASVVVRGDRPPADHA